MRRRVLRLAATIVVTGLGTWYILSQIDLGETRDTLAGAHLGYFFAALGLTMATTWPMAWRWQRLLAAKRIHDRLRWLVRAYFVAYAAGQILPTTIGGDAVRIVDTSRRHPGNAGSIAGSILLERALGGAATLLLGAIGFALAVGHYDVGAYLWIELLLVVATIALGFLFFARSLQPLFARFQPLAARLRVERPLRGLYEGVHGYRANVRLLGAVFAITIVMQAVRIFGIWLCGEAVGVDVSLRAYFVLGPLLLIVMMIPFTINGLAVRESFFVSFLGNLGVSAEAAFATGFLFFLSTLTVAIPGVLVLAWEGLRGGGAGLRVRHE